MRTFNKQPYTNAQHIALLQKRGLSINDTNRAENYLSNINYYRLSAYMLPFQKIKDSFNAGTTFEDILELYVFDRELRLLVLDAIERVEVAVRSQIVNQLCLKYGSHWIDYPTVFRDKKSFADLQYLILEHCHSRNPEVFIAHYLKSYTAPVNPPSWMCVELLTIGQLSLLYKAISLNQDRKDIAAYFSLHHTVFQSWLHTLTYVRNICAHHARLWNRDFAIQPDLLHKPLLKWINLSYNNNRRCYYFLCCLRYLLLTVNPNGHFVNKLKGLLDKHPATPIKFMGFTQNWNEEPLWS